MFWSSTLTTKSLFFVQSLHLLLQFINPRPKLHRLFIQFGDSLLVDELLIARILEPSLKLGTNSGLSLISTQTTPHHNFDLNVLLTSQEVLLSNIELGLVIVRS